MVPADKLAVAIADETICLAWVGESRRLSGVEHWPITRFNTLTDALLAFERQSARPLRGTTAAIGILGATHGDRILLSRGHWAISRPGLRSVFGRDAIVLNDVAARAWAAMGGAGTLAGLSVAAGIPAFARAGRWVLAKINTGVGLAVIDTDAAGTARVLECEMGHCGFAPAAAEERALAAALERTVGPVSWERVLAIPLDDPAWAEAAVPAGRARVALLSRMIGRFAADAVLAHGAWSGAILTGARFGSVMAEVGAATLNAGFEGRGKFARLIGAAPRWQLAGKDLTLAGCAIALDHAAAQAALPHAA